MHRKMLVASVSALVLMTVAAFAHGGASGVVKQRMDAMSDMSKVMKTMATMMRGESPLDAGTIKTSARTILGHSGEALTKLFPENSNEKPSEALDDIWSNWAEFESLADQLKKLATGMESAAGNDLMMAGQGSSMMKGAMMGKSGMMSGGDMMAKSGVMVMAPKCQRHKRLRPCRSTVFSIWWRRAVPPVIRNSGLRKNSDEIHPICVVARSRFFRGSSNANILAD